MRDARLPFAVFGSSLLLLAAATVRAESPGWWDAFRNRVTRSSTVDLSMGPVVVSQKGHRWHSAGASAKGFYVSASRSGEISYGVKARGGAGVYGSVSAGVYEEAGTGNTGVKIKYGIGTGSGVDAASAGLTRNQEIKVRLGKKTNRGLLGLLLRLRRN